MRNEKLNKEFELDREWIEMLGEKYEELPRRALLDMTWNVTAVLFCFVNSSIDSHRNPAF